MREFLALLFIAGPALALAPSTRPPAGSDPGAEVGPFYARAITGPEVGKTICYVCKYGDRPVVMVFVREFEAGLDELLQHLDRLVEKHADKGLRACAFFCGQAPSKAQPRAVSLAFDHRVALPLAIPAEYQTGPSSLRLDAKSAVTIVLYRDRKVVRTYSMESGKLTATKALELAPAIAKDLLDR